MSGLIILEDYYFLSPQFCITRVLLAPPLCKDGTGTALKLPQLRGEPTHEDR